MPHGLPLQGCLPRPACQEGLLRRSGPSHHLCHSPLVRSGSQLLPGLTQGCERQGTGNAGVTLGSVHHKGCPQWGPDLAPPPVPAGLWVPVSGTGHPREAHRALSVSIFLKRAAPLICRTPLSHVYTFLNCFAIIFMKFPEEAEVSRRFSLQV